MEKTGMFNWKKALFEGVIGAAIVVLFNVGMAYLLKPNLNLVVTSSTYNNDLYITAIDVKNFSRTSKDIQFYTLGGNTINEIINGEDLIEDYSQTSLDVNNIPPQSNVCIILATTESINESSFRISSESNYTVSYLLEQKSIVRSVLDNTLIYLIMFVSFSMLLNYIADKKIKNFEKKQRDVYEEVMQKYNEAKADLSESTKTARKNEKRLRWLESYYIVRFSDFSKELAFWKDTIRKLIYSIGLSPKDSEKLFDLVTDSLKTFTVKKTNTDISEIRLIAEKMVENAKLLENIKE